MKKFFWIFLCFVFLIPFAGCAGNGDEAEMPVVAPFEYDPDATVVTIAWWGSAIRHERTLEVLRMFEEQNPDIRFEAEYFDFDGYFTNLRMRVASNEVWDIFQLGSNYPEFMCSILHLDDLVYRGIIDLSQADDEILGLMQSNGYFVGISLGVNTWGIVYDPVMFAEVGLPLPVPQWTWEDFLYAAMTINENLGIWGVGGFPHDGIALNQYLTQMGTPLFHPDDITQLFIDSHEPIIGFLEIMKTLVQSGATPSPAQVLNIPTIDLDPIVFRESGMSYIASNQLISVLNAAREIDPHRELAMVVLPNHAHGGANALVSSQMFSVHNRSENPEYAARFINFFVNDIDANLVLLGERGVPIMPHVRDAIEAANLCPAAASASAFISDVTYLRETVMQQEVFAGIGVTNPAGVENFMSEVIELVVLGIMTPEEGAIAIYEFALATVAGN